MTKEKAKKGRIRERERGERERKLEMPGTCQLFTGGFLVSNVKIVLTGYSQFPRA